MGEQLYLNDIEELFEMVQQSEIFLDQKRMADAIPRFQVAKIKRNFIVEKERASFNLKNFVERNFILPVLQNSKAELDNLPIKDHIENLWDKLVQQAPENIGTLLGLPKPFSVPGGRFNEFFYWDSYYIMLGLQASGRIEMMENIVENAAYLIDHYGLIPNANRTYFLSRSQPPYFALMLTLLQQTKGDDSVYQRYLPALEKEYQFWMRGKEILLPGEATEHVVCLEKGVFLNRHFDNENHPRPESFIHDFKNKVNSENAEFYRDIRAACESGWDFSTRWFKDHCHIETINTTALIPVDLNCLLWSVENLLCKIYNTLKDSNKETEYQELADQRLNAINKYLWNEESGLYRDYNFKDGQQTSSEHIGIVYPLFFKIVNQNQAQKVAENLEKKFLKPGGLVCTTKESGQQWDYPNAWAPYQWLAVTGLLQYGFKDLAKRIAKNWCQNIERVYQNTGKLMEKYDAVDMSKIGGGGEYPNQDGFGWTNAVYMKLKQQFKE